MSAGGVTGEYDLLPRISVASEVMTGAVWLLLALKAGLKTFRRNLSAAVCMDYTSPATAFTMATWLHT